MSRTRTLTNLIADCRNRVGMENSDFVTDAEITEWLNQHIAELHTELDTCIGPGYLRGTQSISVLGNSTRTYALSASVWRVIYAQGSIGGIRFNVPNFMEVERVHLQNAGAFGMPYPLSYQTAYRIVGDNIEIEPDKQAFTLSLGYVPPPTRLTTGSETFDGYAGYEMYPIWATCADMLAKEESDPTYFMGQAQRIMEHIKSVGAARDAANPERVTDVVGMDWWC